MDCRLPTKIVTNFSQILCDAVLMKQHLITDIEYKHLTEVEGGTIVWWFKKIIMKNDDKFLRTKIVGTVGVGV